MYEILVMATIITPVTSGIVQAVKITNRVKKQYLPLLAILIGIGLGAAATFLQHELLIRCWAGGISGLAATGLFELSKKNRDKC